MNKTNIEYPTSNAEHRSRGHMTCSTFEVQCSMFDVCLFAYDGSFEVRMKAPRTKLKTPKRLQVPMSNDQIPKKLQFPNSKLRRAWVMHGLELGVWDLFGVWNLGFG